MNVNCNYGYEYFGNSSWLVIIFLIDRCYCIFMGVLYLNFGGVLEGFVGIGKIEIIKDFVKVIFLLVKFCLVKDVV